MRRFAIVSLVLVAVAVACFSGRLRAVHIEVAGVGWMALGCLVLGGMWGARYARARRGWADYQYSRRQVPIQRRAFLGHAGGAARWVLFVAAAAGLALYLIGRH